MARVLADGCDVVPLTRADLDITGDAGVRAVVADLRPGVIVNCAAYNAVDEAEDDAVAALEVNAFGVRSLARAAAEIDANLVHYGTDFVFDGTASEPYGEEDAPNPQSASMRRRSCWGSGSRKGRGTACCASRACSAAA